MIMTKRGLRKKGINGKGKGAGFESDVCKLLTPWWGHDFHRVPASGGLHWKKVDSVGGDIICEDKLFPLSIECKKQEDWNFDQVVSGVGEVYNYWSQCVRDAMEHGKVPWLVFSKNLRPKFFMMRLSDYNKFIVSSKKNLPDTVVITRSSHKSFGVPVLIGFLDQFLQTYTKQDVLNSLKL